jgi:hypothetical protein
MFAVLLILLILASLSIHTLSRKKQHDHHIGCDQCSNYICGGTKCTQCSSPEKYERPENICYNSLHSQFKCKQDADCKMWQVCLYKYPNQEEYESWGKEEKYCVDTKEEIVVNATEDPDDIFKAKVKENDNTSMCMSDAKKLIVDVDKSGFGNRIVGLLSAIYLAIKTKRILILKWTPDDRKCGSSFDELFDTDYITRSADQAFILWNESDYITNRHKVVTEDCLLNLDQGSDMTAYHHLNNVWLFDKMQQECEILYVQTNRYFGDLLYTIDHEHHGDYLNKLMGPHPLMALSYCIFRVRKDIRQKSDVLLSKLHERGPYMSLHIRSYYTEKSDIYPAMECINQLLRNDVIKNVFLSTDFDEYEALARSLVRPSDAVITLKKELETTKKSLLHNHQQLDSYDLRDNMVEAMQDYHLLKKADYCGATAMGISTFSQVSLASGSCTYIDVSLGHKCFPLGKKLQRPQKVISPNHPVVPSEMSSSELERISKSLKKIKTVHYFPCISSRPDIESFWKEAVEGKC